MSRQHIEFVGHVSMSGGFGEFKLGTFELSAWNEAPFESKYRMHVVIRAENPSVRMAISKWPRNWTAILPRETALSWAILNGDEKVRLDTAKTKGMLPIEKETRHETKDHESETAPTQSHRETRQAGRQVHGPEGRVDRFRGRIKS
jgi:hypothetical protein